VTHHRAGPPTRPAVDALLRRAHSHAAYRAGRPFPAVPLVHRSQPRLRRKVVSVTGPVAFPIGPLRAHPGCACRCRSGSRSSVSPWTGRALPVRPGAVAGGSGPAPVFRMPSGSAVRGRGSRPVGVGMGAGASLPSGRAPAGPSGRDGSIGPVGAVVRVPSGGAVPAPWRDLVPRTRYAPVRGVVPGLERAIAGAGSIGRVVAPPARLPLVFTRPGNAPTRQGGGHPAGPAAAVNASAGLGSPGAPAGPRPSPSPIAPSLTASDVPQLVERVVREIDRRMQARLERRGRP
jgi:hypothetical protein